MEPVEREFLGFACTLEGLFGLTDMDMFENTPCE